MFENVLERDSFQVRGWLIQSAFTTLNVGSLYDANVLTTSMNHTGRKFG